MAAATIDPYVQWLGLPPGADAPDHYALLGVPRAEADKGRIEDAFRARYAVVRKYQIKWPDLATRLLDELSNASVCLTDPVRKAAYDLTLAPSNPLVPEPPPDRADEGEAVAAHPAPSNRPLPELPRRPSAGSTAAPGPLPLPLPEPLPLSDSDPLPPPDPEAEPQPFVRWDDLYVRFREALPLLLPAGAAVIFLTVLGVVLFSTRSRPKAVPDATDEPPTQTARPATPVPPLPPNELKIDPVPPGKEDIKPPIPPAPPPAVIGDAAVVKFGLQPGDSASSVRIFVARRSEPVGVVVRGTPPQPVTSHLFDTGTGTERNSSEVVGLDPRGITDVSPSGKYLVAVQKTQKTFDFASGNDRGRVTVWDTVGRKTVKDVTPPAQQSWRDGPLVAKKYVAKKLDPTGNGVMWAGFVADNRLLTLSGHGGFDIWTFPDMLPKYRVEGMRDYFENLVQLNRVPDPPYSPFPRGFALSADRKTLARFTGDGFQFFDTATGERKADPEKLGGLAPPVPGGTPSLPIDLAGMAFNPRGMTLAAVYRTPTVNGGQIVLYKPTTGKRNDSSPLPLVVTAAPGNHVRWWGGYVVMAESNKLTPIIPTTGEVLAEIHPQTGGAFLPDTRDGLLWVFSPPPTPGGSPSIYSLAAPPALPIAPGFITATPDGLVDGRR